MVERTLEDDDKVHLLYQPGYVIPCVGNLTEVLWLNFPPAHEYRNYI
jgi:hypothetical protein